MFATIFARTRDQGWGGVAACGGARVPNGKRIYVVGDIHGRSDLLARIHDAIRIDVRERPASLRRTVVYLGDYVDRGPRSRDVLEMLIRTPLKGMKSVY